MWIEFDIRYSTFDLNVGFSLIFDIRHSKFECEIESKQFDKRIIPIFSEGKRDLNVGFI